MKICDTKSILLNSQNNLFFKHYSISSLGNVLIEEVLSVDRGVEADVATEVFETVIVELKYVEVI